MALSKEFIVETCKAGQGKDCCRYLACGLKGFECLKPTALKEKIDSKVQYMYAQGDNCEGVKEQ